MNLDLFSLKNKNVLITGATGLLGQQHAEIVMKAGGRAIYTDINISRQKEIEASLKEKIPGASYAFFQADITRHDEVVQLKNKITKELGPVDILINNAAYNPKAEDIAKDPTWTRFENFSLENWQRDIDVGLTGAFFCSQVFGTEMASRKKGVILNISSDLGLIGPDQRLYKQAGLSLDKQPVKPVTYSVVKSGLIGLTRYCATYWAEAGIRVNALCPGGVETTQSEEFKTLLASRIPLGRMAQANEYQGSVLFLISEASSYMTGSIVSCDGGRTCW